MKKIFLGFFILAVCCSCGNKKVKIDPFTSITDLVDSASHQGSEADSLNQIAEAETPKPMEADELFDDFIFNYASDEALQRQRTCSLRALRHTSKRLQ